MDDTAKPSVNSVPLLDFYPCKYTSAALGGKHEQNETKIPNETKLSPHKFSNEPQQDANEFENQTEKTINKIKDDLYDTYVSNPNFASEISNVPALGLSLQNPQTCCDKRAFKSTKRTRRKIVISHKTQMQVFSESEECTQIDRGKYNTSKGKKVSFALQPDTYSEWATFNGEQPMKPRSVDDQITQKVACADEKSVHISKIQIDSSSVAEPSSEPETVTAVNINGPTIVTQHNISSAKVVDPMPMSNSTNEHVQTAIKNKLNDARLLDLTSCPSSTSILTSGTSPPPDLLPKFQTIASSNAFNQPNQSHGTLNKFNTKGQSTMYYDQTQSDKDIVSFGKVIIEKQDQRERDNEIPVEDINGLHLDQVTFSKRKKYETNVDVLPNEEDCNVVEIGSITSKDDMTDESQLARETASKNEKRSQRKRKKSSTSGAGKFHSGRKQTKNFQCKSCEQLFAYKSSLCRHQKETCRFKLKTEEKQFECPHQMCNKTYSHLRNLKEHLNLHSRGKTYFACKICSKLYMSRQSRNKHMNRRHKEKNEQKLA